MRAKSRVIAMVTAFAVLTAAVLLFGELPGLLAGNKETRASQLTMLDLLSEGDIASIKANVPGGNHEVGVFGNSRSVQLTAADVGVTGSFFNYSVPGGSFRQSVNMMELLGRRSVLPKTVVISIDHFEMSFMSRAAFPSGWRRWVHAVEDTIWVGQEAGPELAARSLVDHLRGEWESFSGSWNVAKFLDRFRFLRSTWGTGVPLTESHWRSDGSRRLVTPTSANLEFAPKRPFILHEAYLRRDLDRTARLAERHGVRVIIYESPIDPTNDAIYRSNATPSARLLRERFITQCATGQLECYPAPILDEPGARWSDCCHAPAHVLGRFVGSLINAL